MNFRWVVVFVCSIMALALSNLALGQTLYFGGASISGVEGHYQHCGGGRGTGGCGPVSPDTGTITLTVNGVSVSTRYGGSSTSQNLAEALCAQMGTSFPAQCDNTTGADTTYYINAQAAANYSVSASITKDDPQMTNSFTVTAPSGRVDPKYYIVSLLYAPPGNTSSNGYSNSTTYGATTSVSSSFQSGNTTTFDLSAGLFGTGSSFGWSFGFATTTGNSSSFGWSVSQGQGVSLLAAGPSNAIDHTQDTFVIWLNPEITFDPTSTSATKYGVGTPPQPSTGPDPGAPQAMDTVTVNIKELQNPSLIPASVLGPQYFADGEVLPGLSSLCANPNACVASDFTSIVNADPIINLSKTTDPRTVNTGTNVRYVEVYLSEPMSGPACTGCDEVPNSFTASDSSQTSQTWTSGYSYSTGFTNGGGFNILGFGLKVSNTQTFTWSYSESVGTTSGQTHDMAINLESTTVGCSENVAVFEDTVFHTFAFQQPAGNTSCP